MEKKGQGEETGKDGHKEDWGRQSDLEGRGESEQGVIREGGEEGSTWRS